MLDKDADFFHGLGFLIVVFTVIIASFVGWIWNIIKIIEIINDPITGMFIMRCIGIFFVPLGIIMGYF